MIVRRGLARWILLLEELGRVAMLNGRTWVEREDWIAHGNRDGRWDPEKLARWESSAPKRDLERCQDWLLEYGAELALETIELRDGGRQHRLHVGTRAIADLIEPELRDARVVDECATAKREKRAPDLSWLDEGPSVLNLQSDYQVRKKHLGVLSRKYGMGQAKIRRTLERQRVQIREQRKMRITEKVAPEVLERALRKHDEGGSLADVAVILHASRASARRFLVARGRDTSSREERSTAGPDPPARPVLVEARACERSATCAFRRRSRRPRVSA